MPWQKVEPRLWMRSVDRLLSRQLMPHTHDLEPIAGHPNSWLNLLADLSNAVLQGGCKAATTVPLQQLNQPASVSSTTMHNCRLNM